MPYIGSEPSSGLIQELDALTASATDDYTLKLNSADYFPETVNNLLVSINGVIQGGSTMSLNGAVLTVGATLSSSDTIDFVRVFGNVGTVSTPTDGSVTANKIGSGAITNAKIADNASISGSKLGTDAVLKVYQHSISTQSAVNSRTTGTLYNSTGLFLTITPRSSASKFLVRFDGVGHQDAAGKFCVANIVVNPSSSTNINTVMAGGTLITTSTYGMASLYDSTGNGVGQLSGSILHSPNTASAVTYNVVFKCHSSGSAYWAINSGFTTITAMEIGG